jgi:hypothetical protein
MATLIAQFDPIAVDGGTVYSAQACGTRRQDGLWEGWLAFFDAAGRAWRTGRETVQPNRAALEYWASGLTVVYLEGGFDRAAPASPAEAVTSHADHADVHAGTDGDSGDAFRAG